MRPPGHHAERDRGRGFCVFNNIALAILEARKQHAIERIAVVDWDVHHGNGTQQAFFNDPGVLTISLHQEMLYPVNLGKLTETGEGKGEGYNINVPLPAGSGGEAYLLAMRDIVVPALAAYKPQLIVVACGFDASYFDPMSHMLLISSHFRTMTDMMRDTAAQLCESRLVLNHEGGYSEFYVPFCGIAAIEGLSGIDSGVTDPYRGTASVDNQRIQPHQQAAIDAAIHGPLALLLRRLHS
jgi:acetoin utilization deacetylase AcuC-like enzyme